MTIHKLLIFPNDNYCFKLFQHQGFFKVFSVAFSPSCLFLWKKYIIYQLAIYQEHGLKWPEEKSISRKKKNFAAIDFYESTFFQVSREFIFTNSLSNFGEKLQYLQKLIQLGKLKSVIDAD